MKKKLFAFITVLALLPCTLLAKDLDLSRYDDPHGVSQVFDDVSITSALKQVTGSDYDTFVGNFDVIGEPQKISDGGILIEGWLRDLQLENSSAFVIYPDGRLYAAWVVPESDVIHYKTNVQGEKNIQSEILNWSKKFANMKFNISQGAGNKTRVEFFDTDKFSIKLITECDDKECNNATYIGKRKNDGAALTLKGKVIRTSCDKSECPVIAFTFNNGKVRYMISKIDDSLMVIDDTKVIVNEKGTWSN
jgi:hypothetical protein